MMILLNSRPRAQWVNVTVVLQAAVSVTFICVVVAITRRQPLNAYNRTLCKCRIPHCTSWAAPPRVTFPVSWMFAASLRKATRTRTRTQSSIKKTKTNSSSHNSGPNLTTDPRELGCRESFGSCGISLRCRPCRNNQLRCVKWNGCHRRIHTLQVSFCNSDW